VTPLHSYACSVNDVDWLDRAIAGLAFVVACWSAWRSWLTDRHQKRQAAVATARQVTVILRRFDVDLDPFVWGGPEDRESMKDKLVTVQVFNDGDAEVRDVIVELLVVNKGAWTLLGQQKIDRLASHTESPAVVGGAAFYDPFPLAKGRATFTDRHGSRWVRWSDSRLVAAPKLSESARSGS